MSVNAMPQRVGQAVGKEEEDRRISRGEDKIINQAGIARESRQARIQNRGTEDVIVDTVTDDCKSAFDS